MRSVLVLGALATVAATDVCASLERDILGKVVPFLASASGRYYFGGKATAGAPKSADWVNRENDTIGFRHPFFRDGRARGDGIVCEPITGCGHSLWNWDFYRVTRVLTGAVTVGNETVDEPSPTSSIWRPDRVTNTYQMLGATIEEKKFFTPEGVLVAIVNLTAFEGGRQLVESIDAPSITLHFSGHSYVNTDTLPPGDASVPPGQEDSPHSVKRKSVVRSVPTFAPCAGNDDCAAVAVLESGTNWAKPINCKYQPQPKGFDCMAKVGRMMYDDMTVVVSASAPLVNLSMGPDDEQRQWYNFSITLKMGQPLVLGWAQGDDAQATQAQAQALMSVRTATAAMDARADEMNDFLTTMVPYLNVTQRKGSARRSEAAQAAAAAGDKWELQKAHTCGEDKFSTTPDIHDDKACQALCAGESKCKEWKFSKKDKWCALYKTASAPLENSDYDCGCRAACPSPGPPPTPAPAPDVPGAGINDAYWFGWAMWFLLSLDAKVEGTFETLRHAQSAPNNFMGINQHGAEYWLQTGAWMKPSAHAEWTHGNALMWERALKAALNNSKSLFQGYWGPLLEKGLMTDNIGSTWVSSSTDNQIANLVEPTWHVFTKGGGNTTFLALAYETFRTVLAYDNISDVYNQKTAWTGSGKRMNALDYLSRMATTLGLHDDAAAWRGLLDHFTPKFQSFWHMCGSRWGTCGAMGLNSFEALLVPEPIFKDEWAAEWDNAWMMNSEYGYYAPNRSYGSTPLAFALNDTAGQEKVWTSHTPHASEAMEGMFRHNDDLNAVNITLAHLNAMQRNYGFTVYPEAWNDFGGLWGDQWYLWGTNIGVVLSLERLAGVNIDRYTRDADARGGGILTVSDHAPSDWEAAHVRIPESSGVFIDIKLAISEDGKTKTITVRNNTVGALLLQPWLAGRKLVNATPAGYTLDKGHVCWKFVDGNATSVQVQIVTD